MSIDMQQCCPTSTDVLLAPICLQHPATPSNALGVLSQKRLLPASPARCVPQAAAAKGKKAGPKSRGGSPALQPTRVSKRQKAKAEAQAATAEAEEEDQDMDPLSGAATQVRQR